MWSNALTCLAISVFAATAPSQATSHAQPTSEPTAAGQHATPVKHSQAEGEQKDKQQSPPPDVVIKERVMVIGDADKVRDIPGSAWFLSRSDMERQQQAFDDVHRLLRQVPGVNIQEEDGFGLRPNIGLRGSGNERSSKITLMEDGVLIAPAPYAAPAAYYFPTAGRMEAIEVRKGSSQIKYGPRTNGGALNLVSTGIPPRFQARAKLTAGQNKTGRAFLNIGHSAANYGWLLETYQISTDGFKKIDGGGPTGYEVQDYLGKLRFNSDPTAPLYQSLEVKLGKTKQVADETYLGLTDEDFRRSPERRYAASAEDVFRSDHDQIQARYFAAPAANLDVTVVAYRNNFSRNWYKLQSINSVSLGSIFDDLESHAGELDIARGAPSDRDALRVRANNRRYFGRGVNAVVGWRPEVGGASNEFEFGVRFHQDQEDRFQHEDGFQMIDGRMMMTSPGAPGSQSNRVSDARAWAFFVQDQIGWGKWSLIPGVRVENIELVRTDYARDDPERMAPTGVRTNALTVFVPGIGISYDVRSDLRMFGGIHQGFAPPGPGSTDFTEAEKSINYELGARLRRGALAAELVAFVNDYSNLLGADTLSSGGTGSGDLFNGGEALVAGLEASAAYDVAAAAHWPIAIPVRFSYTYTDAEFRSTFDSGNPAWGDVETGDKLPYLAPHQLHAAIGIEQGRWGIGIDAAYSAAMRTEAGQGPVDPGRATDAFVVWNLSGDVALGDQVRLFAAVENLADNQYIVARRPAGVRPGLPRTVLGGLTIRFR